MNDDRDIERVLGRWLVDGVDAMPDRVFVAVLDRVDRQPQALGARLLRRLSTGTPIVRVVAAVAALVVIVVVAGNLSRPTPSGVGAPSPTASRSPAVSPTRTSVPSASVGVTSACDLITAVEAATALHSSAAITASSLAHFDTNAITRAPSAICWFHSGGSISHFVLVYNTDNGAETFAIWRKSTSVEAVPSLGDEAVWDPLQTTLYILKGDRLVTIEPSDGADPTLTLQVLKAIGTIVAARM